MRALLLILAVPVIALAACGTTEIDADKAETFIAKTVEEQVDARVESVECPTGLEAKKGATFQCTVTGIDGSSGKTEVTGKDDEGNVSVRADFIHIRDLADKIAANIEQQTGAKAQITCPEIVAGEQGDTFDCEAKADEGTRTVRVTQKDDQGNVRYELVN